MHADVRRCDDGEKAFDHLQLHCLVCVRALEAVGHRRDHVVVECPVGDAIGFIPENVVNLIDIRYRTFKIL